MQKGYRPLEVVDAVVRSINPGMRLRSYLEGLESLTFPRLRRILRCHYQEKSATEHYRQLSTLVQEPQQGSQRFLIRALDTIRTRLRPRLQNQGLQDEDLIQQMNEIVLEESERKSKLGSSTRHKNPKVNEVHVSQAGEGAVQRATTDKKLKRPEGGNAKEDNFMAELQAVRSEPATLKESIEKNRAEDERLTSTPLGSQNQQWYCRPLGCPNCQANGRGESCDHYHICGSSDHWARGCRKRNSSGDKAGSGNRRGLQPRERKQPTPMKTLSPRDAFVVKELRGRIKFLSSVWVAKRFGIVDRVARNFTGTVTKGFVRRLNI